MTKTPDDDTRAKAFDVSAAETLLKEMRAWAGPNSEWDQDDATPKQVLAWADRLDALLSASPSAGEGSKT